MAEAEDPPRPARTQALQELARQGELALDKQFRMAEDHYRKSRHFMTLAAGLLVVVGIVAGLVVEATGSGRAAGGRIAMAGLILLLTTSLGFGGAAFKAFTMAYVGNQKMETGLASGEDGQILREGVRKESNLSHVLQEHVDCLGVCLVWNSSILRRVAKLRIVGVRRLWMAGALLSVSLIYAIVVFGI